MKIEFNVVELQKINLEPGDVLSVKLIGKYHPDQLKNISDNIQDTFPGNQIMVFSTHDEKDIKFEVIKQEPKNYCIDCNCGKKEST